MKHLAKAAFAAFILLGSMAFARPHYPPLPPNSPIQPIDVAGDAYMVRDKQNATVIIVDKAVPKIASFLKPEPGAHITCGSDYCAIGQLDRQGDFSELKGIFADAKYFSEFAANYVKPPYLAMQGWYESYAGDAYAYADQCQDPVTYRRSGLMVVNVEGIAAEKLFNYMNRPETAVGYWIKEKSAANDFFYCERRLESDEADQEAAQGTGVAPEASFVTYRCEFKFAKSGRLNQRTGCGIYGATSSAGGGGR